MLRAVLVGILSLSAASACKSGGDSPKSQPGVAAGKVIEVVGTVTVRHADVARPLAAGETIEGDDTIETGADGHVVIELAHNQARWELGANKKQVVRDSLAWKLAKHEGTAKAVDQDTGAAGRPAERNAADSTASIKPESAPGAVGAATPAAQAPAPVAPPPPPAPAAEIAPVDRVRADDRGAKPKAATTTTSKPPPAPPKVTRERAKQSDSESDSDSVLDAKSGGGGAVTAAAKPGPNAHDQLSKSSNAIKACLTKDLPEVQLVVTISAAGLAKVSVKAATAVPSKVSQCVTGIVQKIKFAPEPATVKLTIQR